MGGGSSSPLPIGVTVDDVEGRVGKIGLAARYHTAEKQIEEDYNVEKVVLGIGMNGKVHLATSRCSPSEKFAVKTMHLGAMDKGEREALLYEVGVYLTLDNPHICRLHDVYETADVIYLVMECMEGGELFDRIAERECFTECDVASAMYQMLLAVNYLHNQRIVHRDLCLENFLYDKQGSKYIKLIDFGLSKFLFHPNVNMRLCRGSLQYVAPEILKRSHTTSQCDLWSLGVIVFVLLSGCMPFTGENKVMKIRNIKEGRFNIRREQWEHVSATAREFTFRLLEVDPTRRLTAKTALSHKFIEQRLRRGQSFDAKLVKSLRDFGQASKFRRCCMGMIAWSLTNEDRAKVRGDFKSLDVGKDGTITLGEFRDVIVKKLNVDDAEAMNIFSVMDSNDDEKIHYSDFLAAMVGTSIQINSSLLQKAFKRFNKSTSGYITVDDLRNVLGDTFEGEEVSELLREADFKGDQRISYSEFASFVKGEPLNSSTLGSNCCCDGIWRLLGIKRL